LQIKPTGDLDGTEAAQMFGNKLGVEEPVATQSQARYQVNQGHLAGIGLASEHALAEKGTAQ